MNNTRVLFINFHMNIIHYQYKDLIIDRCAAISNVFIAA